MPLLKQFDRLESLDLSRCTSLSSLPQEIDRLECLTKLHLNGCTGLTDLPDLSRLTRLKIIDVFQASPATKKWKLGGLKQFPAPGNELHRPEAVLSSLVSLGATNWKGDGPCTETECVITDQPWRQLTPSLFCLTRLRRLGLIGCDKLEVIPPEIRFLEKLIELNCCDCESLVSLPAEMVHCQKLENVELANCPKLEDVGVLLRLPQLKCVHLKGASPKAQGWWKVDAVCRCP